MRRPSRARSTKKFLWRPHFHRALPYIKWTAIWVLLSAIFVLWVTWRMGSYNMDEVIYYDVLKCVLYPLSNVNHSCDGLTLNYLTTGLNLPLLSWPYVGSFQAWIYLPIRLLWPSPFSARLFSFAFFLGGSALAAKRFNLNPRYVALFLVAFFPYVFEHIVDTGPVAAQIFATYLFDLAIRRTMKKPHLGISVGVGLLLGCMLWSKPVYLWMGPALAILTIAHLAAAWPKKQVWKFLGTRAAHLLLIACIATVLFGSIVFSSAKGTTNVFPLLDQLRAVDAYTLKEMFAGAWTNSMLWNIVNNPLGATHRMYVFNPPGTMSVIATAFLYGAVPFVSVLYLSLRRKVKGSGIAWTLLYYALFVLTLLMISRTKVAGAMHHALLAYPFLVLAALSILQFPKLTNLRARIFFKWTLRVIISLFVLTHLWFWVIFTQQKPVNFNHPSLEHVRVVLNDSALAEKYIYVVLDWGPHFIQDVYGPKNQIVLYVDPLRSDDQIMMLKQMAAQQNRKLLFVYYPNAPAGDMKLVARSWNLFPCNAFLQDDWWQILAEPTGEFQHACR